MILKSSISGRASITLTTIMASLLSASLSLSKANAQQTSTPDLATIQGSCWQSETVRETAGKCPSEVKDSYFLCLSGTMAGGTEGTLRYSHEDFMQMSKIAPDDISGCIDASAGGLKMTAVDYDISASTTNNEVLLTESRHKCSLGDCQKDPPPAMSGKLTLDGPALLFSKSDGTKLRFSKYEQK